MSHRVIHEPDVTPVVKALLSEKDVEQHRELHRLLDPALLRFDESSDEEQVELRDLLSRFISLYDFISQLLDFTDMKLERDYRYSRVLQALLPDQTKNRIDLGSQVELTHLRNSQTFSGSASLEHGDAELSTVFEGERHSQQPEESPLSTIVEILNERFGTDFDISDQLFIDQVEALLQQDATVRTQALANSFDNFLLEFDGHLRRALASRVRSNGAIATQILNNDEMLRYITMECARRIYRIHRGEEQPPLVCQSIANPSHDHSKIQSIRTLRRSDDPHARRHPTRHRHPLPGNHRRRTHHPTRTRTTSPHLLRQIQSRMGHRSRLLPPTRLHIHQPRPTFTLQIRRRRDATTTPATRGKAKTDTTPSSGLPNSPGQTGKSAPSEVPIVA